MSRKVLVYNLEKDGKRVSLAGGGVGYELMMPSGAQILHVERQLCKRRYALWVLVDDTQPGVVRRFAKFVTGQEITLTHTLFHVATLQHDGGASVIHLFEVPDFAGALPVVVNADEAQAIPAEGEAA